MSNIRMCNSVRVLKICSNDDRNSTNIMMMCNRATSHTHTLYRIHTHMYNTVHTHTYRQTDRETDRQTDTHTHLHTRYLYIYLSLSLSPVSR